MKHMKMVGLMVLFLTAICALFDPRAAQGQAIGPHDIYGTNVNAGAIVPFNGGTNNVGTAKTNTFQTFAVSEYDSFGLQLGFKGTGAATGNVQVFGYQSFDGENYETTPSLTRLITMDGTSLVQTNIDISAPNAWTYKIVIGNTNTTVAVTNVDLNRVFKSPKRFPKGT